MEEEKDAFYVVRKGDLIGVYKTFPDCLAQASSSVCHPPISVYKGYGLPKESEEYLVSHGLKNATYSISAMDVNDNLFGALIHCPSQQPACYKEKTYGKDTPSKRSQVQLESNDVELLGSTSFSTNSQGKHVKLDNYVVNWPIAARPISAHCSSCTVEFDGASKGNPGIAGAGAVLRSEDGSLVCRLSEGVGIATCNVAEYRAVILGMRYALKKGFQHIRVRGDSKLVCMQIQGLWKTKNSNMADLCNLAKQLKDQFTSFQICQVPREFNSEADTQANRGIDLMDGQVQEDCAWK